RAGMARRGQDRRDAPGLGAEVDSVAAAGEARQRAGTAGEADPGLAKRRWRLGSEQGVEKRRLRHRPGTLRTYGSWRADKRFGDCKSPGISREDPVRWRLVGHDLQ